MPKLVNKKRNRVVIEGVCTIRHIAINDKWEVDAGLKLGGSKKHRKRFKSKDEALAYADLLKTKLHKRSNTNPAFGRTSFDTCCIICL